jgi:hypothetical protein
MNIEDLDKQNNAHPMDGHVAATMDLLIAPHPFKSHSLHGNSTSEHRYINASSENSDYILFIIPASWGKGPHDLKNNPGVIRFEPSKGFPNDSAWEAQRGEILITDSSNNNFSGEFYCYESPNDSVKKPALLEGSFKIDFTSAK